MINFSKVSGPSFWFYENRKVKLVGLDQFGGVNSTYGNTISVGNYSAMDKDVEAFIEPGDQGFVVKGELLSIFIDLANQVCNEDYNAGGKPTPFSFAPLRESSIDLWELQGTDRIAVKTISLPEHLKDQRERLIQILNAAIIETRAKLP